jgi:glycosyltransferase involved in cell wall biosynthesis
VGTLEPRKGLDVLVDAAARARDSGSPWQLVLVGSVGYEGREIAEAAASVGAAVLDGVDDSELVDLYRAAEALAAPSLYEGFGVTPLEAMASGTPAVVASGSGGLVETSRAAAVVVSERTPQAWLAAIGDARARRDELVGRGVAHASRFRWADVASAVRTVLAEAAARRP